MMSREREAVGDGVRRSTDELARALDRARPLHERRPDDERAYVRFLEAKLAFEDRRAREQVADLARRNDVLRRSLALASAELARRCAQLEAFGRLSVNASRPRVNHSTRGATSAGQLMLLDEGRAGE